VVSPLLSLMEDQLMALQVDHQNQILLQINYRYRYYGTVPTLNEFLPLYLFKIFIVGLEFNN
jgi:hypothetical protein